MTAFHIAGYPAALAMGLALGLTGGGGSILTVPILVYLFGVLPMDATAYSLAIVGLVALWGSVGAYKNKELHLKSAMAFGVPGVFGVLVSRKILLPGLPEAINFLGRDLTKNALLLVAFSLLMLAASLTMIRASFTESPGNADEKKVGSSLEKNPLVLNAIGFAVGIVAGFVGAGGGFLIVPALVSFAKLEMRQAIGTSLFVISLQSLLGVLGDKSSLMAINFGLFVSVVVLALLGMSLGTRLRSRISSSRLKLGFGVFVLIMGAVMFIKEMN